MDLTAREPSPSRRELRAFRARRARAARRSTRARGLVGALAVLGLGAATVLTVPSLRERASGAWDDVVGVTSSGPRVSAVSDGTVAGSDASGGASSAGGSVDASTTSEASGDASADPAALAAAPDAAAPDASVPDASVPDAAASDAAASDAAASDAAAPDPATVFATELVAATTAERAAVGLAPFTTSACATEQAVARAGVLVAEGRFAHDPLDPVLAACGGSGVGENLALGYATPAAMMAGWMASEGHRANILRAYTAVGIGCVSGSHGMLCAQVFLG